MHYIKNGSSANHAATPCVNPLSSKIYIRSTYYFYFDLNSYLRTATICFRMDVESQCKKISDQCLCKAARCGDLQTLKKLINVEQFKPCVADLSINDPVVRPSPIDYYPSNPDFKNRTAVNSLSCLNRALHYLCDDYNPSGNTLVWECF